MNRSPFRIMEEIFEALEKGKALSINEISKETGIHSITVKRYIRMIELVRKEPEVEVIRTSHSIIVRVRKEAVE